MDNFYVTINSQTKSKFYTNHLSHFTNKLASRISLKGNWEVGLCYINLTNYWLNIIDPIKLNFYYYDKGIQYVETSIIIPKASIISIEKFVISLNKSIDSGEAKIRGKKGFSRIILPRFKYDKLSEFIYCELGGFNGFQVFPDIPEVICEFLGYDRIKLEKTINDRFNKYVEDLKKDHNYALTIDHSNRSIWADYRYNLLGKYHSMFVYCSIIKDSYVGEEIAPLLRCVETPLSSNYGETIGLAFDNPYYLALRTKEFDNIEIKIKDENGDPFPFEHGRVIITLHFRKRQ